MATMRRVTIAEAAKSLGVSEEDISRQIASGALVACQEPAFKNHVWLRHEVKPLPKRKPGSTGRTSRKLPLTRQSATTATIDSVEASTSAPVTTTAPEPSHEIDQLTEAITLLRQDLERHGVELAQLRSTLETNQQGLQAVNQIQGISQSPAVAVEVEESALRGLRKQETLEVADSPTITQLTHSEAPPAPESISNVRRKRRLFRWRLRSPLKPVISAWVAIIDLKIGRLVGRTFLRFSPPLLS